MANFEIENQTPGFFASGAGIIKPAVLGLIFGILIAIAGPIMQSITCRGDVINGCLGDEIGTFRAGLVISAFLIVVAMVINRIDRPIYVVLPAVVIFWNLFLLTPNLLIRIVVYAGLGLLIFLVFSWVARIYDWLIATVLTIIIMIILSAI